LYVFFTITAVRGYAVTQLVEALRHKLEGLWFGFRWGHWDFSLPYSFRSLYGVGVHSASNRNEYQGFLVGNKAAAA
jgi:hypothetical protein